MKKIKISIVFLAAVAVGAFGFKGRDGGSISGKVVPADAASEAWAILGTDTLKAPVTDGVFNVQGAKAGTYTVIIDAKDPFKDVTVSNVRVMEGKATDLGEIKIEE